MSLNFEQLRRANVKRCTESFHPLSAWTVLEWAGAMCGEAGEAANVAKKCRRLATTRHACREDEKDARALEKQLGEELADLVIYADLLAASIGLDLGEAIKAKF